jgi:hypothetical protein
LLLIEYYLSDTPTIVCFVLDANCCTDPFTAPFVASVQFQKNVFEDFLEFLVVARGNDDGGWSERGRLYKERCEEGFIANASAAAAAAHLYPSQRYISGERRSESSDHPPSR